MNGFTEEQLAQLSTLVERAVSNAIDQKIADQVAPLREQVQILRGTTYQLNVDIANTRTLANELSDVVLGNERLKMRGIVAQISDITEAIERLNERLEPISVWVSQIKWLLGILSASVIFIGPFLAPLVEKLFKVWWP
jgi:archaellum component FlaC